MEGKEKGGRDLSSCSKSDDELCELRRMFDEWTTTYKKKYWSKNERERRFKIFCANKKAVDEGNKIENVFVLNDMADMELEETRGVGSPDRSFSSYKDNNMSTDDEDTDDDDLKEEIGGRDLSSCSKSDDELCELRRMFDEWTTTYLKKYWSKKERERRFKIFCANKKAVDEGNKIENVFVLNDMADMELEEIRGVGSPDRSFSSHKDNNMSTDEDTDDLKEERIEFEKWAERHGRKYSSEAEQTSRFRIFLNHKRLIDGFVKANRCSCSTGGYDVEDMDMMCWEVYR